MKKIIILFWFVLFLGVKQSYAIPPPDFIIQITSQLWIYFAVWAALFTTIFWTSYIYLKNFYNKNKLPIFFMIIALIFSGLLLYDYLSYEEKKANTIKNLELKNKNINAWLWYKDIEIYNQYKDLSFNNKVEKLLRIESKELEKWLFDSKQKEKEWESITNQLFEQILISWNQDYVLLDAREDIEFEIWNIPWSIHHRVADLKEWKVWQSLSMDKIYIVICWWWMRWKLVSEFLQSKWIQTKFLDWWVKNWIDYWWSFSWKTELKDVFKKSNFNRYVEDTEFMDNLFLWTKVIDAREISRLTSDDKLEYSNDISLMYNTSKYLENEFNKYNENDKVIVVCNDYINCFDAQLIWIELEKRRVNLLWIYFKY